MNRVVLAAACLALLPATHAHAQRLSKLTGAKLVSICSNAKQKSLCEAYLSGVADGMAGIEHQMNATEGHAFAGATCIPESTGIADLRNTVVSYIRSHDDMASKPAAVPAFEALHARYACKTG